MKDFKKNNRFGGNGGGYQKRDFNKGGFGGGNRDGGRPIEMHQAVCAACGKSCEVPFRPNGQKPVYCRDCFNDPNKEQAPRENFARRDSPSPRPSFRQDAPHMHSHAPAQSGDDKRQLDMIITKLDKLIVLIEASMKHPAPAFQVGKDETLADIVTKAQKSEKKKEKKGYPKKK